MFDTRPPTTENACRRIQTERRQTGPAGARSPGTPGSLLPISGRDWKADADFRWRFPRPQVADVVCTDDVEIAVQYTSCSRLPAAVERVDYDVPTFIRRGIKLSAGRNRVERSARI